MISDIHGNADALKAVFEHVERYDAVWFLGDYVDYGPEPHVVVDIVRGLNPEVILMGNHDYAVAYNTDCRCAQELHELSVYTRLNISMRLLGRDQVNWLKTLPHRNTLEFAGKKIYVVHGSPRSPLYGYLKPSLTRSELLYQLSPSPLGFDLVKTDIVIVGHTHIPMNTKINNVQLLNPGSCGQPRDGDPRVSYAILDIENNSFKLHRVKYDVDKVLSKLRSLKLDETYLKWLTAILKTGRALEKGFILTL